MCPAVAADVNPENVALTVSIVRSAESEIVAEPVAVELFGGTSCAPDKVTVVEQVGPPVGVAVAVAVAVAVFDEVAVAVAVNVGPPPATVTLPFVITAMGSPSFQTNPGWKFIAGSV